MRTLTSIHDLLRWMRLGAWTIADQVLFAGTNLVLMVLLARWLDPLMYGALATAYAAFLLLSTVHTALWTEPMLVLGPERYRDAFTAYRRLLFLGHCLFSILLGFVTASAALTLNIMGEHELASAAWGLVLAAPMILFMWLARRVPYIHTKPRLAVEGGTLYLLMLLPTVYVSIHHGWSSAGHVLMIMGITALGSGIWILSRVTGATSPTSMPVIGANIASTHWEYGRWALVAGALAWLPTSIPYILLPIFSGLEASAEFRAAMNLIQPVLQLNVVVNILLVPTFVRNRQRIESIRPLLLPISILLIITILYFILLLSFGQYLYIIFYQGKYTIQSTLLIFLGLIPVIQSISYVFGAALRAKQEPQRIALGTGISALIAGVISIPLVYYFEIVGAAILMVVSSSALSTSLAIFLGKIFPPRSTPLTPSKN